AQPHPQTNGMVERFNGRVSELLKQTRLDSAIELEKTLLSYLVIYNHNIPQRAINHLTPIQAVQKWQRDKPNLFVKSVYGHAERDSARNPDYEIKKLQLTPICEIVHRQRM
ncbi:MAG: transposase, partial [Methylococcaceae bacterium]|nr:transposase [Methylococcaceae bacterium]